jgi:hypothetical protein
MIGATVALLIIAAVIHDDVKRPLPHKPYKARCSKGERRWASPPAGVSFEALGPWHSMGVQALQAPMAFIVFRRPAFPGVHGRQAFPAPGFPGARHPSFPGVRSTHAHP